jgi:hypothetical protein
VSVSVSGVDEDGAGSGLVTVVPPLSSNVPLSPHEAAATTRPNTPHQVHGE